MNNIIIKKVFIFIFICYSFLYNFSVFWYSFDVSSYNYSTYLVDLHYSFFSLDYLSDQDLDIAPFSKSINLIEQMQYYSNYNIAIDIDYGFSKQYHLDNYLLLVSKLLFQADIELSYIDSILSMAQEDYAICSENKKASDAYFFQWFDSYNTSLMEDSYNDSLLNGICMNNNKIKINAWEVIHKKLSFFYLILEKRYENLSFNKDKLVEDYTFSQGED